MKPWSPESGGRIWKRTSRVWIWEERDIGCVSGKMGG